MDAILVPGGFGERGIEGKIQAVRYAREQKIPYSASASACRSPASSSRATCSARERELDRVQPRNARPGDRADHRVAGPRRRAPDAHRALRPRGTMRLGAQPAKIEPGTLARAVYAARSSTSATHRFEFNNTYLDRMRAAGLHVSAYSEDAWSRSSSCPRTRGSSRAVPPGVTSTPRDGHPLSRASSAPRASTAPAAAAGRERLSAAVRASGRPREPSC